MFILGQVRLSKGQIYPAGLGIYQDWAPLGQNPRQGQEIGKNSSQIISIILDPDLNREVHQIRNIVSNSVIAPIVPSLYKMIQSQCFSVKWSKVWRKTNKKIFQLLAYVRWVLKKQCLAKWFGSLVQELQQP